MKAFISMGTLLFVTFAVAVTALGISVFAATKEPAQVITQIPVEPVRVAPTVAPVVSASPSASISPTKKVTTAPTKTVTPVVSTSPAEER